MTSPSLPTAKISEFDITPIDNSTNDLLGYYVTSTASINVEDEPENPKASVDVPINEIAQYLVKSPNPQVVISIHGYATKRSDAKKRYQKIYKFATQICQPKSSVFLGYCWPAENPVYDEPDSNLNQGKSSSLNDKLKQAFQSLPTLLIGILSTAIVLGIITTGLIISQPDASSVLLVCALVGVFSVLGTLGLLKLGEAGQLLPALPFWVLLIGLIITAIAIYSPINITGLLVILLILFTVAFAIILALIALRLATYLRDSYRSTNYGVLDFVELIRKLDQAVFDTKLLEQFEINDQVKALVSQSEETRKAWATATPQKKLELWANIAENYQEKLQIEHEVLKALKKVKLTFIGHSMGALVVTNTIRILSDVFDTNSINKIPSSEIGRAFKLGRLILVAPDIPVEAIMPRRANFLRSSLRRCEEAYVFSNEGDLALRVASTAANYFSFPAKTRFSGYRLGNITVKRFENHKDHRMRHLQDADYGIVNFNGKSPYCCLEIRASDQEHKTLDEIRPIETIEKEKVSTFADVPIADLFTYFDCTDYTDYTDVNEAETKPIVSYGLRKSALNFWDYVRLGQAYFVKQTLNVHGGFFGGKFSQKLMYELAFLGFQGLLERLQPESSLKEQLGMLSTECRNKYIQVILSSPVIKSLVSNSDEIQSINLQKE